MAGRIVSVLFFFLFFLKLQIRFGVKPAGNKLQNSAISTRWNESVAESLKEHGERDSDG